MTAVNNISEHATTMNKTFNNECLNKLLKLSVTETRKEHHVAIAYLERDRAQLHTACQQASVKREVGQEREVGVHLTRLVDAYLLEDATTNGTGRRKVPTHRSVGLQM